MLVIHFCVTNRAETWRLKTVSTHYLTFSQDQEFGGNLAGWWFGVPPEAAITLLARAASSEGSSRAGGGAVMASSHGCGQEVSVLLHMALQEDSLDSCKDAYKSEEEGAQGASKDIS